MATRTRPIARWLVVFGLWAPTVWASKALVYKPAVEPPVGQPVVHQHLDTKRLEALGAAVLAEYQTYYLLDVPDALAAAFQGRAAGAGFQAAVMEDFEQIKINGYSFPSRGPLPVFSPDLSIADYAGSVGLYLVQMIGPGRAEWYGAIKAVGEPILYYPENTYLVRGHPAKMQGLKNSPFVQHLSVYQPAYKVRQDVRDATGPIPVTVQLDGGQDLASVVATLGAIAGRKVDFEPSGPIRNVTLTVTPNEVRALAALPQVLWIEQLVPGGPSDERQALAAAGQVYFDGSATRPNPPAAYPGAYQLWLEAKGFCTSTKTTNCTNYWTRVAVFDSGLDLNICGTNGSDCLGTGDIRNRHLDLSGREYRFFCASLYGQNSCLGNDPSYPNRFAYSDEYGHGTAVTGVISGDPIAGVAAQFPATALDQQAYYLGTGVAPLSQVVTFRIWNRAGGAIGDNSAAAMESYHAQLYTLGAHVVRFANHSWREGDYAAYTSLSQRFDQLVRDSDGGFNQWDRPMTLVVASANNPNYCTPTPSGTTNALPPANAKNVISVGAVENWRPNDYDSYPWPTSCGAADSLRNVACYSRRGVGTDVNRFKPDLVAPGTRIGSAFTRVVSPAGFGCFVMPGANDPNGGYYVRTVGTSFAAPVVTGAAVLAETWYYSKTGQIPSPAMLKAMLVAHADDLAGGSDRMTALTLGHRPSMAQGWGRVNLDRLFQTAAPVTFLDEDHGTPRVRRFLQGDPGWSKTFQVGNTGLTEVILVMAFTDAPAAVNASPLYVNDNNLYVLQGGWSYRGNYFDSAAFSVRSGGLPDPWLTDPHNNVEMLRIRVSELAPTYQFTVEVTGGPNANAVPGLDGNVPNQDFALYVYNAIQVP